MPHVLQSFPELIVKFYVERRIINGSKRFELIEYINDDGSKNGLRRIVGVFVVKSLAEIMANELNILTELQRHNYEQSMV